MISHPNITAKHVFLLLAIFWGSWLYTEFSEKLQRDDFFTEVDDFMHKGDRFTREDGEHLQHEIDGLRGAMISLSKRLNSLEGNVDYLLEHPHNEQPAD